MLPPKTPPPPPTMSVRSPSPDILQPVVYARLHHFRGKSSAAREGRSKQVYNIDALQVVFGREESCDIRIYADNVSRKHCKIVIDLLTGKATLHVLSSHGLKLNRVPLAGGTVYTLQDDDIINVMERKFRFEYASGGYEDQDETSSATMSPSIASSAYRPSIVQPILPPSPAIARLASPARKSTRPASTPLRHAPSTRMHLFPKDYASEEVRAALVDIGVEMESPQEGDAAMRTETPGRKARKEDFVYLEDREELDAEEHQYALGENEIPSGGSVAAASDNHISKKATPLSAFSTPQPARKVTRVPRTSLAPRTRKMENPVPFTAHGANTEPILQLPQTPSSVQLPPSAETPYFSAPQTSAAPTTPSIYPSLDQLSVFTVPHTPSGRPESSLPYQTPRNVPLPAGNDTPYGSFVPQTPQSSATWEIDPSLVYAHVQQESGQVEDVEMEDVSEYQDEEQEHSRSPAPHLLALANAPMTPRNVPLPLGGETPYTGAPATPVSAFAQQPEPTSPEQDSTSSSPTAMPETPRAIRPLDGQVSLRRRLLLRSAHKVMQEQISRRDMRRTMGVGSGLIGTPMRPQRGVDRSSVVLPASQPMTPITEFAFAKELPHTPLSESRAEEEAQMTPSRVALPSPGGTEYDVSLDENDDDEESTPMEDYAEPIKDHDEAEGDHVSLAMYQTDAGEDEDEGEDEDAEGETDHEEDEVDVDGGNVSSPATPMGGADSGAAQQEAYFASVDGADAIQVQSPSASQQLFRSNMMESVSDDDLVDRSLDISPDMEEASDVDHDSSDESQQSQEDQAEEDMSQEGSDEDEQDKENEPLVTPEEGEEEQRNTAEEPPSTPASPSRAVRRPLVEEYYTPQPLTRRTDRRGIFGRKSLSSLGGPAVRGTPRSDIAPMKHAFARMSLGDGSMVKQDEEDEEMREEEQTSPPLAEPKLEDHLHDEKPYSTSLSSRHPAMAVSDNESSAPEIVTTPLQGLKNKLKDLRRKSTHVKAEDGAEEKPFNRRATFGVPLPETPITRESRFEQRGINSAAPLRRFMPRLERQERGNEQEGRHDVTKDIDAEGGDDQETNAMSAQEYDADRAPDAMSNSATESDAEDGGDEDQGSETTPNPFGDEQHFTGEQAEEPQDDEDEENESSIEEVSMPQQMDNRSVPATPMLKGIREMLKTPKAAPGTPQFSGMKHMFNVKPELATPEMSGIVDLFPELQASSREDSAEEPVSRSKTSETAKAVSKLPTRNKPTSSTGKATTQARTVARATTAASRSRAKPAGTEAPAGKPTTSAASTGIRRVRAAPAAADEKSTVKPKATRARPAQELAVSTSTDEPSVPAKPATRAGRARTATAEPDEKLEAKVAGKVATRAVATRTTRAKSAAPVSPATVEEDAEADPLDDINVPEPDPEEIKPLRKTTRTATASRTVTSRPLAARSALPQPSQKADSPDPEKPKTRTRATAAVASRLPKSSTEAEEVSAPVPKRATRAAAGSRLTAPTASSKARATPPPTLPPAPVRKTRAAAATSTGVPEAAEASGIPKRVTRARK